MVMHTFNPCTWETNAEESGVQNQTQAYTKFKVSLGYLKKKKKKSIYHKCMGFFVDLHSRSLGPYAPWSLDYRIFTVSFEIE